jgi:hypothetical protein
METDESSAVLVAEFRRWLDLCVPKTRPYHATR